MEPALYPVGTRQNCPLPGTGKYWGLHYGRWAKVVVQTLPTGGGTGGLVFAPVDKRGYPYTNGGALSNCDVFWGPVASWGARAPRIGRQRLLKAGASKFWLDARTREKRNAAR